MKKPELLDISPFRAHSIDFKTVEVTNVRPFVKKITIPRLDEPIAGLSDFSGRVFVNVYHQCFDAKLEVTGEITRRNIIRHVRDCYRIIYREATRMKVRSELDPFSTIIVEKIVISQSSDMVELCPHALSGVIESSK